MIPQLNAKEVAAVFSAPFSNFLRAADREAREGEPPAPPGAWYDGSWISWKDEPWRVHNFYVPVHNQRVAMPDREAGDSPGARGGDAEARLADELERSGAARGRFKVWGMTARMLVDAATIAYGRKPEFEHNDHFGDEKLILMAEKDGSFAEAKEAKM